MAAIKKYIFWYDEHDTELWYVVEVRWWWFDKILSAHCCKVQAKKEVKRLVNHIDAHPCD